MHCCWENTYLLSNISDFLRSSYPVKLAVLLLGLSWTSWWSPSWVETCWTQQVNVPRTTDILLIGQCILHDFIFKQVGRSCDGGYVPSWCDLHALSAGSVCSTRPCLKAVPTGLFHQRELELRVELGSRDDKSEQWDQLMRREHWQRRRKLAYRCRGERRLRFENRLLRNLPFWGCSSSGRVLRSVPFYDAASCQGHTAQR